MNLVIIGTGNAATVLGRKFKAAGHNIMQIYGRNTHEASALAYELDTESTAYWSVVSREADVYIIAVSDVAIADVLRELQLPHKTIVHTAGSVSKNILQSESDHYGVLWPLQSLVKGNHHSPRIPVVIDASDAATLQQLLSLAHSISDTVVEADDDARKKLHLAAIFCNNFSNHLFALMQDYCRKEALDFNLLKPLIKETFDRLEWMDAASAQTGPAARHDQATIDKHMALLKTYPELQKFYSLFTQSIQQPLH